MNGAGDDSGGRRRELAKRLAETAGKLVGKGLRFEIPETIRAGQIAWPAECPVSEPELRAEVQALRDGVEALRDRARKLHERLPQTPDPEFENEVPQSLYFALYDAISLLAEGHLDDALDDIDKRLAATPESLWRAWLRRELEECLGPYCDSETRESIDRLVRGLPADGALEVEEPVVES